MRAAALKREHYATAPFLLPLAKRAIQAQANVGYMYEEGLGVTQQFDVALQWYEKAAVSGSMQASHNLGMMFTEAGNFLKCCVLCVISRRPPYNSCQSLYDQVHIFQEKGIFKIGHARSRSLWGLPWMVTQTHNI